MYILFKFPLYIRSSERDSAVAAVVQKMMEMERETVVPCGPDRRMVSLILAVIARPLLSLITQLIMKSAVDVDHALFSVNVYHPALFSLVDGRRSSTSVDVHFTALFISPNFARPIGIVFIQNKIVYE